MKLHKPIELGFRAEFRGFGVFYANDREERIARNPKGRERISVKKKKIHNLRFQNFFYEILNK